MTLHLRPLPALHPRANVRIDEKRKAEMKAALEREVAQMRHNELMTDYINECQARTVKRRHQPYYIVR